MSPKKAQPKPVVVEKSLSIEQTEQPTDRDLSLSETSDQDEAFLNASNFSETFQKSVGNNKLAELNSMIKNKEFQIQKEDEDDFEQFISRLNKERSANASEVSQTSRTPARSVIEEQKQENASESSMSITNFKIDIPTAAKGQGAAALLKHMQDVVKRDEDKKARESRQAEDKSSFYTTFNKEQSPQK